MWLTRLSLRRPVTLLMALASVLVLGLVSFGRLPLALLPQVEFPFIGVVVPYPGGIPSEVEREIARPIEEILATLGGVREIMSNSDEDQAFVGVWFDWGRDVYLLRMEVQEKIDQIRGDLPPEVRDILLFTFNSNDIPIVEGRIAAKGRDLSESYDLIEQRIIAPLQRIPGVGVAEVDGVNPTEGAIYLRFDRIREYGVDVGHLFEELAAANISLTVGRITDRGLRYDVRVVSGLANMQELGKIPIDARGLRLEDVAEVVYAAPAPSYGRHLNREFAIAFWIQKASGYNTVEVSRAVMKELEQINLDPALQGIHCFTFFNQGDEITHSLEGLWRAGLFGSALAMLVLFLFLRRISLTLLVALAIPLSILGTGIFLYLTGKSLNILTMMGLMLGIGMLVDNAVVVLESIHRRRHLGASAVAAALKGTRDVGRAIAASTLTTVIVFAPIIVSRADELAVWLGEVGITISTTIVCSLLVSLTVIPALSIVFARARASNGEAAWLQRLRQGYLAVLRWTTIRHPLLTGLVLVPAVLGVTGVMMGVTSFKPDVFGEEGFRQERLRIDFEFSDPVDKRTACRYVQRVEEYLETRREELGIENVYSFYGPDDAAISLFFVQGVLSNEFLKETRKLLREELPVQAGLKYRFGDEEGNAAGAKQFSVTVFGEDTELLTSLAAEAKRRLSALEGVSDLISDADRGHTEIRVHVDPERASRFQVRPQTVSQVLGLTYRGTRLPRLNTGQKEIDLRISLLPEDRESIENLSVLPVGIENGQPILLGQLADFRFEAGPQTIYRRNQKTGLTVRGSYEGERLDDALDKIRVVMDGIEMPLGYGWSFGTEIQEAQEQRSDMGVNLLLALLCVFCVMASLFESLLHPLIVMGCVPFASLGVFWLMMATGTPFNFMAMIGMVILVGIVVNNGIVLVDHVNGYRRRGLKLEDALLSGCAERMRPILMTAGTTIIGLLPLALFKEAHVADAQYYPMARAIIGGLFSSTLLTLIVLPTYYRIVNTWAAHLRRCFASAKTSPHGTPRAALRTPLA
jgi:HAE1 family hydrophobic/amphiphilic exporter-1